MEEMELVTHLESVSTYPNKIFLVPNFLATTTY